MMYTNLFNLKKHLFHTPLKLLACATLISGALHATADVPAMSVQGNKVLVGGEVKSLGGMSYFWSNNGWGGEKYYNASTVSFFKQDWKASIVRAAMGVEDAGGYFDDPQGSKQKVRTIVDAAIANDMYVIIDWHSHYANTHDWAAAVQFFQEMARDYGQYNNVIYEVYNEPLDIPWGHIKSYAETVIDAIRAIDPDNVIVVGTPRWSQGVKEASWDPINRNNIAYTLHFYSGSHGQWLRNDAAEAMNNGIALFVTEWGSVNANGDGAVNEGETAAWMNFMRENGIHHANWSVNDKAEGASALNPGASTTGGWGDGDLTWSGHVVRGYLRDWNQIGSGNGNGNGNGTGCTEVSLPGTIEAEAYCAMDGIQTENTSDTNGGGNVGYIDAGDWMSYSVNVANAGTYTVSYRVASLGGGGVLSIENAGGSPVYGTLNVPQTGGWQEWTTVSHDISLQAGQQNIGIAAIEGGFNINWIALTPAGTNPNPVQSITLQAEDYSFMSGVQVENTSDNGGGMNVGWLDAGDWLAYHGVDIPTSGQYTITYRVASQNGGGSLQLEQAGGGVVYGNLNVPSTGGWQNWVDISHTVTLSAGAQDFGLGITSGGFNINWIKIEAIH